MQGVGPVGDRVSGTLLWKRRGPVPLSHEGGRRGRIERDAAGFLGRLLDEEDNDRDGKDVPGSGAPSLAGLTRTLEHNLSKIDNEIG